MKSWWDWPARQNPCAWCPYGSHVGLTFVVLKAALTVMMSNSLRRAALTCRSQHTRAVRLTGLVHVEGLVAAVVQTCGKCSAQASGLQPWSFRE